MKKVDVCSNLQTECVCDVRLGQRDDHTGDISLLQPLGQQLKRQKLVQPRQTLDMEGQQQHHAGLPSPQRQLQNLHHVFHVFIVTVQTWRKEKAEACTELRKDQRVERRRAFAII